MTFTFTLPFDDVARVRFHIGDINSAKPIYDDETIEAIIAEYSGSWQRAVIAALNNMIAQLRRKPDFKADWLEVPVSKAIADYMALRDEKYREFGIPRVSSSVVHFYRVDSGQNAQPDYSDLHSSTVAWDNTQWD